MSEKGGYPYEPDYVVPPGWILQEYLETRGMSVAELGNLCGISQEKIGLILVGGEPIDAELANKLATIFDLKANVWIRMETSYREGLKQGKRVPQFEEETVI